MIEQGTPEWHALRLGKATASRIADVVARTKSGWGASRYNYMADLIAERLSGKPKESYINAAMKHGTETEPDAIAAYEFLTNIEIERVAFVPHPTIAMAGCSPDGLVGENGMVEAKCPETSTHIDTLLEDVPIADKYIKQMQWQMCCAGRAWCDFISFDPRLPDAYRLFVKRIPRDDVLIKALEKEVIEFLAELEAKLARLTARFGTRAAA